MQTKISPRTSLNCRYLKNAAGSGLEVVVVIICMSTITVKHLRLFGLGLGLEPSFSMMLTKR